jgi:hypothetical protein
MKVEDLLKMEVREVTGPHLVLLISIAVKDLKAALRGNLKTTEGLTVIPNMESWGPIGPLFAPGNSCYACLAGCAIFSRENFVLKKDVNEFNSLSEFYSTYPSAKFLDSCRFIASNSKEMAALLLIDKGIHVPVCEDDYDPDDPVDVADYLEHLIYSNEETLLEGEAMLEETIHGV